MLTKVFFSEEPDKIRYKKTSNGFADIWLRTNIEKIENENGIQYTADENYFRVNANKMTEEYVKANYEILLNYDETDIRYGGTPTVEDRLSDIESTIADLVDILGGILDEESII